MELERIGRREIDCCEYPAPSPEIMVESQPMLPLRVMSGSMVIQQQESVLISVAHITTGDHV